MHLLLWLAALLGAPFWETKTPREWTGEELHILTHDSPWAQDDGIQVYLATARPMREAEEQLRLRARKAPARGANEEAVEALEEDYRDFLAANPDKYVVVAARLPDRNALADAREVRTMEKDCLLRVGRARHKLVGHFPPSSADPYLRLVFPRVPEMETRNFSFDLYLPSADPPYKQFQFWIKDLLYRGKREM